MPSPLPPAGGPMSEGDVGGPSPLPGLPAAGAPTASTPLPAAGPTGGQLPSAARRHAESVALNSARLKKLEADRAAAAAAATAAADSAAARFTLEKGRLETQIAVLQRQLGQLVTTAEAAAEAARVRAAAADAAAAGSIALCLQRGEELAAEGAGTPGGGGGGVCLLGLIIK